MTPIRYYNRKTFTTLTEDTPDYPTDCNSITFENKGEVKVTLETEDETRYEIPAGEAVIHNNQPYVQEITFYKWIRFEDVAGKVKKLVITKEHMLVDKPEKVKT